MAKVRAFLIERRTRYGGVVLGVITATSPRAAARVVGAEIVPESWCPDTTPLMGDRFFPGGQYGGGRLSVPGLDTDGELFIRRVPFSRGK